MIFKVYLEPPSCDIMNDPKYQFNQDKTMLNFPINRSCFYNTQNIGSQKLVKNLSGWQSFDGLE